MPTPSGTPASWIGTDETAGASGIKGKRKACFPDQGDFVETPIYDRYSLPSGTNLLGPAIIEERECTTIVGFQSRFSIDQNLNLIIDQD